MRISPKVMGITYFIMGILFIYMAILSAGDTIWNVVTILLALVATLDFVVGIRLLFTNIFNKKE